MLPFIEWQIDAFVFSRENIFALVRVYWYISDVMIHAAYATPVYKPCARHFRYCAV